MKVILTIENGPDRGRQLVFDKPGRFTVGRGPEHHAYRLKRDGLVSRSHFAIEILESSAIAHDLSSNGTFVSGRGDRFERYELRAGDLLIAGDTVLRVSMPGSSPVRCLLCGSAGPVASAQSENPLFYCSMCRSSMAENPVLPSGYELVGKLGQGGLGTVFAAKSNRGADRAIKILLPQHMTDAISRLRFLREATILARLRHPNIVRYYHLCELDFEKRPGIFCIVMEYFRSMAVDALLREREEGTGLSPDLAFSIVEQSLAGLAYAHSQGVVHRDIKPGNILVAFDPSGRARVKLCDFGLAKLVGDLEDSVVTVSPNPIGTIFYMAPEQIRDFSHVTPAADIFSMGAVFYRLLTGYYAHDFPPEPVSIEHYAQVLKRGAVVPIRERDASIPEEVADIVERALAFDPHDRFATAAAMRDALRAARGATDGPMSGGRGRRV